jgi:hypothetical protein
MVVAAIVMLFLVFFYMKQTEREITEGVGKPGTSEGYVDQAKKSMDDVNKSIEKTQKEADNLLKE